jgi:predicted RNA-binding Zn-ribbon protein involved in translation (DUF1610 family)
MIRSMQERIRQFQQRLTRLDNQPLSRAALVVIVFLDLFILVSIFDGLADHTAQLTQPDQRIPPLCRSLVIEGDWNPTNRLDSLARIVSRYHARQYEVMEQADGKRQHPLCAPIVSAYEAIRDDAGLARNLGELGKLRRETLDLRAELDRMKGAYDTTLLEKIAGQQQAGADTSSIRKAMADKTAVLNERVRQQGLLEASLEQDPRVRDLFARVAHVSAAGRKALLDELRRLNFWYPAERLGMEMLFLLPLLAVFYYWNAKSIVASRPFQALVSSHLLVVVLVPVFLKVVELLYDIIPRKLLRQLVELLESLKLVAIWHYLLIGVAIVAALAVIYLFQKKLFSREKLLQRRIAKGLCQACGLQLPAASRHCPACGAAQYRTCSHCNEPTHVHGRYCTACGFDSQPG